MRRREGEQYCRIPPEYLPWLYAACAARGYRRSDLSLSRCIGLVSSPKSTLRLLKPWAYMSLDSCSRAVKSTIQVNTLLLMA